MQNKMEHINPDGLIKNPVFEMVLKNRTEKFDKFRSDEKTRKTKTEVS